MRSTVLTIAAALAVAMITPALAAKPAGNQAWRQDQASNPQSFQACVDLAKQRGFSVAQDRSKESYNGNTGARRFVEGCMAGRFR